MRYGLCDQTHRVVVIGDLGLDGVCAIEREGISEIAEVIMHGPEQGQRGQVPVVHVLVELPAPLLNAPVIGQAVIKTPEVWTSDVLQAGIRGGTREDRSFRSRTTKEPEAQTAYL